jgi:hypothetical protein
VRVKGACTEFFQFVGAGIGRVGEEIIAKSNQPINDVRALFKEMQMNKTPSVGIRQGAISPAGQTKLASPVVAEGSDGVGASVEQGEAAHDWQQIDRRFSLDAGNSGGTYVFDCDEVFAESVCKLRSGRAS